MKKKKKKKKKKNLKTTTGTGARKGGTVDPADVAKKAAITTGKVIPSTQHVFERYWSGDIANSGFTGPKGVTSKVFWQGHKAYLYYLKQHPKGKRKQASKLKKWLYYIKLQID